ncbi:hypothetical protein Moror_1208 [Moniliophthora roreri MCA 2997]|uniref:Uncharacterized protein n=1 Tax=Moniliophthora roreri (strain MCA 2997) TaxID=1381753 RepID=V2WRQ8_MONRO|nr:hypothetical protein Moror_1208 [Moniliophthora roreri MCA 2997]
MYASKLQESAEKGYEGLEMVRNICAPTNDVAIKHMSTCAVTPPFPFPTCLLSDSAEVLTTTRHTRQLLRSPIPRHLVEHITLAQL